MTEICIIGGGAAGMAAAITAAEQDPELNIRIFEKKDRLGTKLMASGNGRCNLSNTACKEWEKTKEFFGHLGLLTRIDAEGRVYPYVEDGKTVLQVLRDRMDSLGIVCVTEAEVKGIERRDEGFRIETKKGKAVCDRLLLATGGKSAPQFGTTGDGCRWAKAMGHDIRKLVPVLTAVETVEEMKTFAGIRAKGRISLRRKGKTIFSERGEIQFTATGISGICVFNLSRFLMIPEGKSLKDGFEDYRIFVDFFPEIDDMEAFLSERSRLSGLTARQILRYSVKEPIAEAIYRRSDGTVKGIAAEAKAFSLTPCGVKGWKYAQATRGGVNREEINWKTMESKLVKDLYFAGEVIDYDGPCGGFNLQNAWETGIKAGRGIAHEQV